MHDIIAQMTQETLNIFLIIFFAVMTGCLLVTTYFLVKALKVFINIANHLNETAESLRSKLQLKALTAVPAILLGILRNFRKRG